MEITLLPLASHPNPDSRAQEERSQAEPPTCPTLPPRCDSVSHLVSWTRNQLPLTPSCSSTHPRETSPHTLPQTKER